MAHGIKQVYRGWVAQYHLGMRAVFLSASLFIVAAMVWAVQIPLLSFATVRTLTDPASDHFAAEEALLNAGSGAALALDAGIKSDSLFVRLHCARVLARNGDHAGDKELSAILRTHPNDFLGVAAELALSQIWQLRDSPEKTSLKRLAALDASPGSDVDQIKLLGDLLLKHPGWSNGYVRRARIHQRNNEAFEARRDALSALMVEPDNFEAIEVLVQAYLAMTAPEQAYICVQQALYLNPRLRDAMRDEIRETLRALDIQGDKQRIERRRERPVV